MIQMISFDMDGTLIGSGYTDWVWHHGIPTLYSEKTGLSFDEAKAFVIDEYKKIGEGAIEWYDIKYWVRFFQLETGWKTLLEQYIDKINVYPDVNCLMDRLKDKFPLILTSNAGREFIDVEMEATGLGRYFNWIFSATSDFQEVKKTPCFYRRICEILKVLPEELLHVGDHYEFDYLIPRTLGIRAYYLDRTAREKGDSVLWELGDIEKRLYSTPD
ncbi:MAG TPA: HAD family hydrolase [Thermodesulfobacteriota bacterium]|nr:HAD family hydrolase [Thermodesulfobacteriota bacterium]